MMIIRLNDIYFNPYQCCGECEQYLQGYYKSCPACRTFDPPIVIFYECENCGEEGLERWELKDHAKTCQENKEEAEYERHYKGESDAWSGGFADNH